MEGFSVYKTIDQWEMIYHISQPRYSNSLHTSEEWYLIAAATVGGILALMISGYRFLIWDLNTGMQRYLIDTQHWITNHFLSSDGGTLAIITEKDILLYSTETGDTIHRFDGSSYRWHGFIEGDRYLYGSYYLRGKRRYFIVDTRSTSRLKRYIAPLSNPDHIVQDIMLGEKWDGTNGNPTVVLSFQNLLLETYFLDDVLTSVDDKSHCAIAGGSDLVEIPEIIPGEVIPYSGGTFVIQEIGQGSQRKISLDIRFKDGRSRQYWWINARFYFRKENPRLMMVR
ncbi:hypothetical protein BGW38_006120, partial [Lunasporangiospora selenospora]